VGDRADRDLVEWRYDCLGEHAGAVGYSRRRGCCGCAFLATRPPVAFRPGTFREAIARPADSRVDGFGRDRAPGRLDARADTVRSARDGATETVAPAGE